MSDAYANLWHSVISRFSDAFWNDDLRKLSYLESNSLEIIRYEAILLNGLLEIILDPLNSCSSHCIELELR